MAVVIDLFNREVVGWALSNRLKKGIIIEALYRAINNKSPGIGLIFHSDKGSQYASKSFRKILNDNGIVQSMGKSGSYDNAVAESFFHLFKTELVYHTTFASREMANREIFEYIEVFYNRYRPHSINNGLAPKERTPPQKDVA